jgi:hypothetical protein
MERSLCRTVTVLVAALLAGGTAATVLAQTTTDLALVSLIPRSVRVPLTFRH